ncbi:two-component system, LytT family, sensor histidine kinase NatK [[Bacillus] enclensis]|uniref:Two-component system, LytT family, sensor histidine kinase NatK n=1 Tax=[Bacillus] enclensis TaxID=1402860 RepID=A0A1C3YVI2_9BACI|nr:GHKL domain-containing protein [[Bacillus] enclensis]SCB74038.1 two-component system, LytT family, sensor histidine kinase NatK [[Bacillus] enclensis]
MKHQNLLYWTYMALFSFIHLHFFLEGFSLELHYAVLILVILPVIYYLHLIILLPLSPLGARWNFSLFVLQSIIIAFYYGAAPAPEHGVLFLLFIGLEFLRIAVSRRISGLTQSIRQLEDEQQQLNDTFRVVRSERHDFLKHISAIHFMLEHDEITEAKNYFNDLVDGYEETNLSIRGERGSAAGILHDMYRRGRRSGIEMVYDLDMPLSTLPLSDKDLVTLLGNLLSNSLEACEEFQKHKGKQAEISLQFYKRSGLYMLICKNDSLEILPHIVDKLYASFGHTTKTGSHEGLGTMMIDDVVKRHGGYLDFIHKNETFMVKIKFPAVH